MQENKQLVGEVFMGLTTADDLATEAEYAARPCPHSKKGMTLGQVDEVLEHLAEDLFPKLVKWERKDGKNKVYEMLKDDDGSWS